MRLLLLHPGVAFRDCECCLKNLYDEKTGKRMEDRKGNPLPRPKRTFPPCRYRKDGCAKGTPENQKSLSDKNVRAFIHYQECKAVGQFPDDPIVRRNAAIIRGVEESVREERMLSILAARNKE